jgi:hypothetical protein
MPRQPTEEGKVYEEALGSNKDVGTKNNDLLGQ